MPGAGIMVNFTAVEPPLNVNRFSNANHSDVFSWMVTDSRGKTQTFLTFDFKDHPNPQFRCRNIPAMLGRYLIVGQMKLCRLEAALYMVVSQASRAPLTKMIKCKLVLLTSPQLLTETISVTISYYECIFSTIGEQITDQFVGQERT